MSDKKPEELALVTPESASPLSLIERLIDQGKLSPEAVGVVERLVHLQEHVMEKNAEKAFARSFADLQAAMGPIKATKAVPNNDGTVRYTFAPYEEIMEIVRPLLEKYGFTVSFSTDFREGRVIETCVLRHLDGHSQSNTALVRVGSGPPKATETQADGAAMTYAKRYALCSALNIVCEHDTDARNEGTFISDEQAQYLEEQVKELHADEAAFLKLAAAKTYAEIATDKYRLLVIALKEKAKPK
jgi:hypothetical protein